MLPQGLGRGLCIGPLCLAQMRFQVPTLTLEMHMVLTWSGSLAMPTAGHRVGGDGVKRHPLPKEVTHTRHSSHRLPQLCKASGGLCHFSLQSWTLQIAPTSVILPTSVNNPNPSLSNSFGNQVLSVLPTAQGRHRTQGQYHGTFRPPGPQHHSL